MRFSFSFLELDITPTLSKLNGDPKKVKEITKNIKDLVKLLAVVLAGSRSGQTLDYIEYNTTFLRRYSMVHLPYYHSSIGSVEITWPFFSYRRIRRPSAALCPAPHPLP